MVLTVVLLLGTLSFSAPGDIYRCANASGAVSFQDKPCASGTGARLATRGEDSTRSLSALQRWLDAQGPSTPAVATNRPATARAARTGGSGGVSEAQLAGCSERFLFCAQGNAAAMDACIERLPRCAGAAGGACCPQACISRYQTLRGDGHVLASAVRLALLDPAAPACALR